ncbi:MAG: D-lyxose/D-mannose family sugar isomerase [Sphaerochaetaceae bacterium]
MKRSEINAIIDDSIAFIEGHGFKLPPFVRWTPADWNRMQESSQEIKDNMLGWDITDFGSADFDKRGLIMLTLRNGNLHDKETYPKAYAEKLLITGEDQETPIHFHWSKMEDIINRGGGNLLVELWNSDENEEKMDTPVTVSIDGTKRTFKAGEVITIKPGESISLVPGLYHRFYGEVGSGRVLLGEVSSVNDDKVDNRFYETLPRFPAIEEDEPARYLLITEY